MKPLVLSSLLLTWPIVFTHSLAHWTLGMDLLALLFEKSPKIRWNNQRRGRRWLQLFHIFIVFLLWRHWDCRCAWFRSWFSVLSLFFLIWLHYLPQFKRYNDTNYASAHPFYFNFFEFLFFLSFFSIIFFNFILLRSNWHESRPGRDKPTNERQKRNNLLAIGTFPTNS